MIRPKARPMLIQTVDSIAASLIEMTCAVRCTSSRSTTSIATIDAMSANQTQTGTAKLAKFPAWAAGARADGATRLIIGERGQRGGTIAGASRSPVTLSGGGPRWTGAGSGAVDRARRRAAVGTRGRRRRCRRRRSRCTSGEQRATQRGGGDDRQPHAPAADGDEHEGAAEEHQRDPSDGVQQPISLGGQLRPGDVAALEGSVVELLAPVRLHEHEVEH